MKEVWITTDFGSAEHLSFTAVEHSASDDYHSLPTILLTYALASCLILSSNTPVILLIWRQASKSFLDWLIVADCVLSIVSIIIQVILGHLATKCKDNITDSWYG